MKQFNFLLLMLFLLLPEFLRASEYPISFIDSSGQEITVKRPERVVSLVPSITEMLLQIGAGDTVVGTTYHLALPPDSVHALDGIAGKELVGGFFSPDLDRVAALRPDVIFYADLQKNVPLRFHDKTTLIQLSPHSIAESFDHLKLLGRIFSRKDKAAPIIAEEKRQLAVIASKITQIPEAKRQRTIRLMGRDKLMTPGDDSFQNDYIRAAGGIAPQFGKTGNIISVDLDQWQAFNPQVIYGCGDVSQSIPILDQPGLREVEAVRNKRIFFFPCELTCRAATRPGFFTSWLAARIYSDEFSAESSFVLPEQVVSRVPLKLDLDYVQQAEMIAADIKDFRHETVALTFKHPMQVVSTLEGQRS